MHYIAFNQKFYAWFKHSISMLRRKVALFIIHYLCSCKQTLHSVWQQKAGMNEEKSVSGQWAFSMGFVHVNLLA